MDYAKTPLGRCGKITFSKKRKNWLLNQGGTFKQAMTLINRVKRIHKLFGKKCETEVIIWDNPLM